MKFRFKQWILTSLIASIVAVVHSQEDLQVAYQKAPHSIQTNEDLSIWLSDILEVSVELNIEYFKSSPIGDHITYSILREDIPLHRAVVKWNKRTNGSSTVSYPMLQNMEWQEGPSPSTHALTAFAAKSGRSPANARSILKWVFEKGSWRKAWIVQQETNTTMMEYTIDEHGDVTNEQDLSVYDHRDTLVKVNVFHPDPLTSAEAAYGVPFVDANDKDSDALTAELLIDTVRMHYDSNNMHWELSSNIATAIDYRPPDITPPTIQSGGKTRFTRSQPEFEYYNVFFHIHQMQYHLRSLGFEDILSEGISYDAHGSFADQSYFTELFSGPFLSFGIGGVDDAEDADVIIHEYGHGISNSVAPSTNFGSERAALDEGVCDYFAISYSRRISDFNRSRLFSWDTGEGVFWDQRALISDRTYPTDLTFDIYDDGLLWASAIAEIADYTSLDQTDRVMVCSLYEWYAYMQLSDAATLFLEADSLCNDGQLHEVAKVVFCNRGLLNGCEDTLISELPLSEPYLGNSFDFSYNREPLFIFQNNHVITRIEVMDLKGRLILYEDLASDPERLFYEFQGTELPQGLFVLRVITTEGEFSFKVVSLWR